RRLRGEDVVIAAMQPNCDSEILEIARTLETTPTRQVDGVPVIDVPAVLKRRPNVCIVDGLAYDNPPGSRHAKRYEDVDELLHHGISVITSINLEYIAEQQEFVRSVTGRSKADTVPQAFVTGADELVVVDAPGPSRLRERALLLAADVVDRQLEAYLEL